MKLGIVLFPLTFFLLFSVQIPLAQINGIETVDDFFIRVSDETPSPGDIVDINLFVIGSRGSEIGGVDWLINGVVREEFRDEHNIKLLVGQLGTNNSVYARILFRSRETGVVSALHTNIVDIRPIIFDLMWEADSVVPPGYKGLPLPGPHTPIRVSAYVRYIDRNGDLRDENDFFFEWERNSQAFSRRGVGQNTIIVDGVDYIEAPIRVAANISLGSEIVEVRKNISVNIEIPKIILYKFDPLTGLNNLTIRKTDIFFGDRNTISLYPLFVSNSDFNGGMLNYDWSVNGNNILNGNRKVDISSNTGLSSAEIKVSLENSEYEKYTQRASHSFLIGF